MTEKNTANAELKESKIVYVQDLVTERASQLYTLRSADRQSRSIGQNCLRLSAI